MMKKGKVGSLKEIQQHSKKVLTRALTTVTALFVILFLTHITTFYKYGYNLRGKLHHSFLDYPNEIASKDAIELSGFMESLHNMWKTDKKIYTPFDKEEDKTYEKYWVKKIDVKDRHKKSRVIHKIAKELGLASDKFLPATINNKVQNKPKAGFYNKIGVGSSSNDSKINNKLLVPQCNMTKLLHHKSTIISFSSQQFKTTNIKLDGLFNDGGSINIRTATTAEEKEEAVTVKDNHIKLNLTLYAQSDDLMNEVTISQVENDSTKSIHIHSQHRLASCLMYQLDIVFPSKLVAYKNFHIKANHASSLSGDLMSIAFKKFTAGLGRGSIHLQNLNADIILVGTLNGIVLGNYFPVQSLDVAAVKGATNIEISPQSKYLKSTIVALDGPAKASVTEYGGVNNSGRFTAHCWLCKPMIESATISKSKYIHIKSSKRKSIKMGYFKEKLGAQVNVHSKYGESKLIYT